MIEVTGGVRVITGGGAIVVTLSGEGPQGPAAPIYYGTGSPPDPTDLPDGALFFKYT